MKIKVVTFLLALGLFGYSQNYTNLWQYTNGGINEDQIKDVKTDSQGNIYVLGSFHGTVDFDPGTAVYSMATAFNHTEPDLFILKLDASGNFLWAKSFGSDLDNNEDPQNLALDAQNNVYATGYNLGSIQFYNNGPYWNSGTGVIGYRRPFIVKLDSLGGVQWGRGWKTGPGQEFNGFIQSDLIVDSIGNSYLSGYFQGNFDLDPDPIDSVMKFNDGTPDGYLIKLDTHGNYKSNWIAESQANWISTIHLAFDHVGKVVVVGKIKDTIDFDNSPAVQLLGPPNPFNTGDFICKLDTALNFVWAKVNASGGNFIYNQAVVSKSTGNIYFAGQCLGNAYASVDPNNSTYTLPVSPYNGYRTYLLKLDSLGNTKWITVMAATSLNYIEDLALDENENLTLGGSFTLNLNTPGPSMFFNSLSSTPIALTSNGGFDAYLARFDSSGTYLSSVSYGGSGNDRLKCLTPYKDNELLVGGYFTNTVNFGLDGSAISETSAGDDDMYLMNVSVCDALQDSIQVTACGSFTLPGGSQMYSQSGVYQEVLSSTYQCDSLVILDLTILPSIQASIVQSDLGLQAMGSSSVAFQWLDCSTNQIIPGATDSVFMPSSNGQYAVITSNASCTDTSACFSINNVSINEEVLLDQLVVYPNPTTGLLNIETNYTLQTIEVSDLMGRVLLTVKDPKSSVDLSRLPKGIYLVKVKTEHGEVVRRVVKE